MRTAIRISLLATALVAADDASQDGGCTITVSSCKNFPDFQRTQFRDGVAESHLSAGSNEAACLKRAEDFHHWCGNGAKGGAQVAATYNPQKLSQIYHPGACDAGWSQWDAFCLKHFWEKKTWFEAEAACRYQNAHLASVHSQAENRFVYTLTRGLSAWIGYTDLDQDTHFQWSDNTNDDFSNFAKNCTGREHEPDCKPEEKAQQWFDWEGGDKGTYVCKRNALLPVALLRNVTPPMLSGTAWPVLLPMLAADSTPDFCSAQNGTACLAPAVPTLKTPEIPPTADMDGKNAVTSSKPSVPQPKFGMPKGMSL